MDSVDRKGGDQMKSLSVKLGFILIGSLIFLFSCSSEGKWIKPGSGESELDKDYKECKSLALQECDLTVLPEHFAQTNCINHYMKDCLHSRGWEYRRP
jgi:hypothetical protein